MIGKSIALFVQDIFESSVPLSNKVRVSVPPKPPIVLGLHPSLCPGILHSQDSRDVLPRSPEHGLRPKPPEARPEDLDLQKNSEAAQNLKARLAMGRSECLSFRPPRRVPPCDRSNSIEVVFGL